MVRKALVAVAAVLVLTGAAVGVAGAQAQPTPTPGPRASFETALANRLHINVDQLRQAMQGARQDVAGTRPTRPTGFPRGGFAFLGAEAQAVAGLFKESVADLRAELPGSTLQDLATRHNVQTQDVVNTIVQTADQQIDQFASNCNLPADRESQLKQQISERAQQFVTTHRFPARGSGTRS